VHATRHVTQNSAQCQLKKNHYSDFSAFRLLFLVQSAAICNKYHKMSANVLLNLIYNWTVVSLSVCLSVCLSARKGLSVLNHATQRDQTLHKSVKIWERSLPTIGIYSVVIYKVTEKSFTIIWKRRLASVSATERRRFNLAIKPRPPTGLKFIPQAHVNM